MCFCKQHPSSKHEEQAGGVGTSAWFVESQVARHKLMFCVLHEHQVNTAKGPWRLLDLLEVPFAGAAPHPAFLQPRTAAMRSSLVVPQTSAVPAAAAAAMQAPAMSLDAVRRAVRDVAADIAGDDMFEGATIHPALWHRLNAFEFHQTGFCRLPSLPISRRSI